MKTTIRKNPNYVNPNIRGYNEYFDHLIAFNKRTQEGCKRDMQSCLAGLEDGWAIATTGSDARLEKGPVSPIETVLFTLGRSGDNEMLCRLKDCISRTETLSLYDQDIDVRDISKGRLSEMTVNKGQPNQFSLISPNRMLDVGLMFGNESIYRAARDTFFSELTSELGSSIFEKVKDRTKEHRFVTSTGTQKYSRGELLKHFDLDNGLAYYNPQQKVWSFKQGPIRAIQYALVRDIIKYLRHGGNKNLVSSLPSNTIEKLNLLEVDHLLALSHNQLSDLSDNYKYFLWAYHKSQNAYKCGLSQVDFDAVEVRERCKTVDAICSSSLIKIPEIHTQ
jgi:hypothetical protein